MTMNYVLPSPMPRPAETQALSAPSAVGIPPIVTLKEQPTEQLRKTLSNTSGHTGAFIACVKAELARRGAKPAPIAKAKPKTTATKASKPTVAPKKETTTMKKSTMTRAESIAALRKIADDPKAPARERKAAGEALAKAGDRLPPDEHAAMLAAMGVVEPKTKKPTRRADGSVEFPRILPSEARARARREQGGVA